MRFAIFALPCKLKTMKNYFSYFFFFCSLSVLLFACKSKQNDTDLPANLVTNPNTADGTFDKNALPEITFEKDFHNFEKLVAGEQVSFGFKFKNTGKSLLIVSNVSTSCGCTVSSFPKQPIKPGEESVINVSFDTKGRHGLQTKTISVFTNTQPPTTTLRIQAQVVEAENL